MKIFHQDKHVKTIPAKFGSLPNLDQRFKDHKYKRLSNHERLDLEMDLFRFGLPKYVKELVEKEKVNGVEEVITNDGNKYYVVIFGRHKVKAPLSLYNMYPKKGRSFKNL